jgi:F-type H+-transporting ATPase subunit b
MAMVRTICLSMLAAFTLLCVGSNLLAQESKEAEPKAETPANADADSAPVKDASKGGTAKPVADPAHAHAQGAGHAADAGHADGGHAHDELDNTHKDATAGLLAPQEMRFDLAVATFAIFLLLSIILAKFAWGPITQGLDKREASIAAMIEQARLAQEQAEAQLRSYEAKLAAAAEEARSLVAQARIDAEATRERELAATKAENEKLLQRNKDEIEAAKNAALQQIAERSVSTAISLASSIVRREVKPEDHDALVTDALGKFSKLN